ncbi:MAG TPA: hypothetical protein VLS48_00710, partial [Anaerolineales bacterium]|nr:hypothetical protein [Anaerolineales bacterium]
MQSKLNRYALAVMEAAWLAAVIRVPVFFNVYSSRIFEPDKITLLRTLALVTLAAWIVAQVEGRRAGGGEPLGVRIKAWLRRPLVLPVVGLAVVYLLATAFSVTPAISLWGSYQRLQGLYTTLAYLVIFMTMATTLREWAQVERLMTAVIVASLPVALYGVLQRYGLDPIPWGGDVSVRIAANMGNSIFIAAYMIMAFPLTVGRIVRAFQAILKENGRLAAETTRATFYIFIGAVQVIALYMSGSRGPVMGWLAGLFVTALLFSLLWRKRGLAAAVVGAALVVGAFLFALNIEGGPLEDLRSSPAVGRFSRLLDPESSTALVRKYIWEGAADLVMPHEPLNFPDGGQDTFNFLRPLIG